MVKRFLITETPSINVVTKGKYILKQKYMNNVNMQEINVLFCWWDSSRTETITNINLGHEAPEQVEESWTVDLSFSNSIFTQ